MQTHIPPSGSAGLESRARASLREHPEDSKVCALKGAYLRGFAPDGSCYLCRGDTPIRVKCECVDACGCVRVCARVRGREEWEPLNP